MRVRREKRWEKKPISYTVRENNLGWVLSVAASCNYRTNSSSSFSSIQSIWRFRPLPLPLLPSVMTGARHPPKNGKRKKQFHGLVALITTENAIPLAVIQCSQHHVISHIKNHFPIDSYISSPLFTQSHRPSCNNSPSLSIQSFFSRPVPPPPPLSRKKGAQWKKGYMKEGEGESHNGIVWGMVGGVRVCHYSKGREGERGKNPFSHSGIGKWMQAESKDIF